VRDKSAAQAGAGHPFPDRDLGWAVLPTTF